jgi:hypothetical protein
MGTLGLPEPYAEVDRLIEAGDVGAAARALAAAHGDPQIKELVAAKMALVTGAQSPDTVMQKLILLMRDRADLPGAKELYQEVSRRSFEARQSSVAYSHPPPPMVPKKDPTE